VNGNDLNRFSTELRDAIREALEVGWTAKKAKSGWKLRSPGGTKWMHVTPGTNIPETEAKKLRAAVRRAQVLEVTDEVIEALEDPKTADATVKCDLCEVEFMTWTGYAAHQEACQEEHEKGAYAASEEPDEGITLPEVFEAPETDVAGPFDDVEESQKSNDSAIMNSKEEDNLVDSKGRADRGGYTWNHVRPGLARDLYEAIKSRSRHKGETDSKYANALAEIIEKTGENYVPRAELEDAQQKLLQIMEVLGVDPTASREMEALRGELERKSEQLKALKELLADL
jgi:hypothetical protein